MTKAQRKFKAQIPMGYVTGCWDKDSDFSKPMLLRDGNGESSEKKVKYDLEERTARFGEAIIRFAKRIPQNPANNRVIEQLVGAGTSVGANYCEADDAAPKRPSSSCEWLRLPRKISAPRRAPCGKRRRSCI